MSKQSEAKEAQCYTMKQVICGNCKNYSSDVQLHKGCYGSDYTTEKNRRCTIGGFVVKKTGTCKKFTGVA